MKNGDVVEVEVTGIGRLTNTVVEVPAPRNTTGHAPRHNTESILRVAYGSDWWAEQDAKKAASVAME